MEGSSKSGRDIHLDEADRGVPTQGIEILNATVAEPVGLSSLPSSAWTHHPSAATPQRPLPPCLFPGGACSQQAERR